MINTLIIAAMVIVAAVGAIALAVKAVVNAAIKTTKTKAKPQ